MMERRSHSEKFNIRRNNDGNYHFQRNHRSKRNTGTKTSEFQTPPSRRLRSTGFVDRTTGKLCEGHYDEMHQVIEQYFLDKGLNVKYWDDEKLQFTLDKK